MEILSPFVLATANFAKYYFHVHLDSNFRARGLADVHIFLFFFVFLLIISFFLLSILKFHVQDTNPFKSKESSRVESTELFF